MFQPQIQLTADGSHTLFVPEIDEHYHSVNGAIQEARHVYIDAGLGMCGKRDICVLELGFGTGLNALLTCLEASRKNIHIRYYTVEKYPLPPEIFSHLNYGASASEEGDFIFRLIHSCEWEKEVEITPGFSIIKLNSDFKDLHLDDTFDIIYYDAFAPDKQPEVWSEEIFKKLYAGMNPEGVLTTYCAKGMIRRVMIASGFEVERIPGPPGKREMLRARKPKTSGRDDSTG